LSIAELDYRHRAVEPILTIRVKIARIFQTSAVISLLVCSCATPHFVRPRLPPEVSFNRGAGRGDFLFVTLRVEKSEEMLFVVDTGQPFTVLDKSLESKLGKCVFTNQVHYVWYPTSEGHVYRRPRLYLGNTRLKTEYWVHTDDLSRMWPNHGGAGGRFSGVLGMDCLQNYCVQLDFADGKMRFLDPDHLKTENLGNAYSLTLSNRAEAWRAYVDQTLLGPRGTNSWIDTGDPNDGWLVPKVFERELQSQKGVVTKKSQTSAGNQIRMAKFPSGAFGGETYTNLNVGENPDGNIIGLRFLARNLVTFNFPKRVMYLKQERAGPLEMDTGLKEER
jgi:hypothetical protein